MRPQRPDIAVPETPPRVSWCNGSPGSMAELTATGAALVHFFDFAQLNSVRTLPYLREWHRRYADLGLTVLGIQAPRFRFGGDRDAVERGLRRLEIAFPVAIDADREHWLAYGCEGWPSLFLWGRGGALRWVHFGEGEYEATEEAISEELLEIDALVELPAPMAPLRPSDVPGAKVMPPTDELFPEPDAEQVEVSYEAAGAFVTAEGLGRLPIELDGAEIESVPIVGAGLYELSTHPVHEAHSLRLRIPAGVRIWSVSFAPGVPS